MRLTILLAILFSLCGCAGLPERPEGNLCIIDIVLDESGNVVVKDSKAVCSTIEEAQEAIWSDRFIIHTADGKEINLRDLDKFVAFDPDTWGNIVAYIDKLKQMAKRRCP